MPKTPEQLREMIDGMTYEELFRKRRFAPAGHPLFRDKIGEYFEKVLKEKEKDVTPEERVAISKRVGWDLTA